MTRHDNELLTMSGADFGFDGIAWRVEYAENIKIKRNKK